MRTIRDIPVARGVRTWVSALAARAACTRARVHISAMRGPYMRAIRDIPVAGGVRVEVCALAARAAHKQ